MPNLANALTLSRFVSAPAFLFLVLDMTGKERGGYAVAALALLAFTLLTDMLDGMVARAYNDVTDFGKIMDPVADSTFFLTAMFAFSAAPRFAVPVWLPMLVLYREVGMHVLRRYSALTGHVMAAKFSGKAKMFTQSVLLTLLVLAVAAADNGWSAIAEESLRAYAFWALAITAAVNVLSLGEYIREIPALARRLREGRTR